MSKIIPLQKKNNRSFNNQIKDYVNNWNERFPLDKWWRSKHSIPFGSQQHKDIDVLSIRFEFEEQKLFNSINKQVLELKNKEDSLEESDTYVPGTGDIFKSIPNEGKKVTEEELADDFDSIEI